ncbi:MAG: hypothetical protein LW875_05255 [Proteobacteria bacterium]|nr:hypothetical protein [Pseudomonadota bacterium]
MKNRNTMAKNDNEFYDLMADWFDNHPKNRDAQSNVLPITPEVKAYLEFLWPMAESYYSPITGVFLLQVVKLELLNKKQYWMVRDGLLPLLWFFRLHPKPTGLNSKLLVEESLLPFVPEAWNNQVGSYKLVSTAKGNGKRKLLLVGYLSEFFMPLDEVGSWFTKALSNDSQDELKKMSKSVFLPYRQWHFQSESDHFYHLIFTKKMIEALGSDFEPLTHKKLQQMESTNGYEVLLANSNLLLSDNALVHNLLSKGAKIYGDFAATDHADGSEYVAFSPYHGVRVQMNPEVASIGKAWNRSLAETEKFQAALSKALHSDAHTKLPWPQWFSDWAKVEMKKHSNGSKK